MGVTSWSRMEKRRVNPFKINCLRFSGFVDVKKEIFKSPVLKRFINKPSKKGLTTLVRAM